jgi:hypothetical protein
VAARPSFAALRNAIETNDAANVFWIRVTLFWPRGNLFKSILQYLSPQITLFIHVGVREISFRMKLPLRLNNLDRNKPIPQVFNSGLGELGGRQDPPR